MMYYTAEWIFENKTVTDFGLISANDMREAGEWAQDNYGNDLISICFTPIEEPFLFSNRTIAETELKNQM